MTDAAPPADSLAAAAIRGIEEGMVVGLGTGRAATRGVRALGDLLRDHPGMGVVGVATSARTAEIAAAEGIPLRDPGRTARVDLLFDGADEVDPHLRMLKGGGGAMTREKLVAAMARHRRYLVQETKLVPRLGARAPLPIEVLPAAIAFVLDRLAAAGLAAAPRERVASAGRTDDGHPILDAALPADADLAALAALLDALPGVVGHGLFLEEADEVVVEDASGAVRTLTPALR